MAEAGRPTIRLDTWLFHAVRDGKAALTRQYKKLNPAQLRREILDLQDEILATVRAKHQPAP